MPGDQDTDIHKVQVYLPQSQGMQQQGQWGEICMKGIGDILSIGTVICRQLGHTSGKLMVPPRQWVFLYTVDFTCIRTLRVPCVRPCVYIDQNLQLRTTTEWTTTPSRTIPWKSVKLTCQNFLYALSHAKYGSSNASEIDSNFKLKCVYCVDVLELLCKESRATLMKWLY